MGRGVNWTIRNAAVVLSFTTPPPDAKPNAKIIIQQDLLMMKVQRALIQSNRLYYCVI